MKTELWRSVVAVLCCTSLSGCTTSRWVTDSRQEVIPDSSVTQARPVLNVVRYSQERPELLVRLTKERTGPIELQEVKHEEVHKVWGISPWKIIGGWLELGLSPVLLVGETVNGSLGRGIGTIISGMMAATGFNPPLGWGWDLNERDVIGEGKTEVMPLRDGTQTIPWASGPVEVKIEGLDPINLQANQSGYVEVNFKQLPVQLTNRSKDLILTISAQADGVTAVEHVTVPVSTIVAWEQKEAERVKITAERKVQEEREAITKREREAQQRREALARREEERREKEAERERRAAERAESNANFDLMMQGVGMLGEIVAAQQQQKAMAAMPAVPTPRSAPSSSAAIQSMTQMAEALTAVPGSGGSSASSPGSSGNAGTRYQHNPANEASRCISIDSSKQLYGVSFINNCSFSIEVTWCANTQRQPSNCAVGGYDSTSTIKAGGKISISPLDKALSWEYGACKKGAMYFTSEMSNRREYKCVDR